MKNTEAAQDLTEIMGEIKELIENARGIVQNIGGLTEQRAEAYWLAHIEAALSGEHEMATMQETIDEIEADVAGVEQDAREVKQLENGPQG